jgi:cyclic-di-GMP phosphodiesterase TipF (flagellum assembly factor)
VVESKLERNLAKGEATVEPLAVEINELGALLDQLAETVALHETQLAEIERAKPALSAPADPAPARAQSAKPKAAAPVLAKPERAKPEPLPAEASRPEQLDPAPLSTAAATDAAESLAFRAVIQSVFAAEPDPAPTAPAALETVVVMPVAATAAPAASVPARPLPLPPVAAADAPPADKSAGREMLAAIRSAIEANRIDLHLQPIVTLPQRKVRFYEAMSRLRTQSGDVVLAAEFISQAEAGGLMPKIDNLVVFRCVQVLRRLLLKNREVGVFCNLSVATLTDAVVFPQLLEFLDANRAIAPSLVLEFTQSGLRGAGPIETESLAALRACGFSFSMDNVTDLRLEPRELASRGFRFVKLRANLILNRSGIAADIHPGDLPDLLGRFGIDLIAEKIESEGSVVDLLDYDVKFGQGFLFSPPRPVRAEALQGITDRNDVVARESAAPEQRGGAAPAATKDPRATAGEPKGLRSTGLTRLVRRV